MGQALWLWSEDGDLAAALVWIQHGPTSAPDSHRFEGLD